MNSTPFESQAEWGQAAETLETTSKRRSLEVKKFDIPTLISRGRLDDKRAGIEQKLLTTTRRDWSQRLEDLSRASRGCPQPAP